MAFYQSPSVTGSVQPELRVWLGGGSGWSVPLQLSAAPRKPQVLIITSSVCYALLDLKSAVFSIALVRTQNPLGTG